ncbi:hypothetical protein [Streptomyces sp. sk2.1]|jgi:hypothetical protein|uniref:hypothetical protein n=1 Tax=Streptomyces sp. sk2.1 TaxID=2478959 RepID=UPI0011E6147A|nr:hypothetical protein [Streptomyces sp. sk2.1]TXS63822.1 hypothetical protein EAO76_40515 [Streptomyces sp. sk2.1]
MGGSCGKCHSLSVFDDLVHVAPGEWWCERCCEDWAYDGLVEDRNRGEDDSPTMPVGDPDEAQHRRGRAA